MKIQELAQSALSIRDLLSRVDGSNGLGEILRKWTV